MTRTPRPGQPVPAFLRHAAGPSAVPPPAKAYYGWACVAAAALAMVATLPGRTMGLGLATESLVGEFGLTRTRFGSLNLLATLVGAGFGLAAGRAIDRLGARAVVTATTFGLGLTALALSRATTEAELLACLTLLRGLGQSALSVASIAIVGKWFERRVGTAMAVYSVLLTVGFMIAMPSLDVATKAYGWRPAWAVLGLALVTAVTATLWLVVRRSPESVGLVVDGGPAAASEAAAFRVDRGPADRDWTLRQAVATPAFWLLAAAGSLFNAAYSGITLFNESILAERGYVGSPTVPLAVMVFAGMGSNFLGGWLASRWSPTRLMAAGMAPLAVALAVLPHVGTPAGVAAYAAALGLSAGVVTVVFFAGWGQLFGRRHLGQIQGAAQLLTVVASAVGPVALSATRDATGSYGGYFLASAAAAAALAAWGWFVPSSRPSHPRRAANRSDL